MFSPSQTKTFSRCRFKWYLSKCLGVDYSSIGKRDLAGAVGTSVGAAIQSYYLSGKKFTAENLIDQAVSRYAFELEKKAAGGRSIEDCEEAIAYPNMIPGMIHAFFKNPPIPNDWVVTSAEANVSDGYAAYLDLAGTCPRGHWIADVKCKMKEKGGFIHNSLMKYQFDPQLLQYVREWSKKIEKKVEFYRIIYVVGSPLPVCTFEDFEIDWDHMALRAMSDNILWAHMKNTIDGLSSLAKDAGGFSKIPLEQVMVYAPMASEHMDGIFKCDMWDICLTHGGQATPDYIQIERKL